MNIGATHRIRLSMGSGLVASGEAGGVPRSWTTFLDIWRGSRDCHRLRGHFATHRFGETAHEAMWLSHQGGAGLRATSIAMERSWPDGCSVRGNNLVEALYHALPGGDPDRPGLRALRSRSFAGRRKIPASPWCSPSISLSIERIDRSHRNLSLVKRDDEFRLSSHPTVPRRVSLPCVH